MPSLLFEIGCEELPASACAEAEAQLRSELAKLGKGSVLVGPRRLVLLVDDLPEREPDEWVKGPPENLRERAAEGFAKKQGVDVDDLEVRDGLLGVLVPGRPLLEALPERLNEIVRGLAFSKSMRWDDSGLRFARPVRWLCAKLDDRTVEGFGGSSYGHRFTHGEVQVPSAREYFEALRAADVEPDPDARLNTISQGLRKLGLAEPNQKVLAEVVHLAEWPTVLEGAFDERFLSLPRRVVETAMESHQRYFPLESNRFAFVANGGDPAIVVAGNEAVLEGRLEDASFTFERDVAKGIERLAEESARITFVAGAGSYGDKVVRLEALVDALGGGDASREAARLAKADQAAELVREFPDLEGHIGAEYARLAGFPEAVCAAIDEQYLPDSAGGPLPETETGRVLAAADKVDSLTVAFTLGQRPTGSRDPYGLRRAAIGLCRLALEGNLELDVAALSARAHELLVDQGRRVERRRERGRRVRRGAAGGDARRPRRVRPRRANERRHGARCNRPPRRGSCGCRRHRGVRAGLRRLRPREPIGGKVRWRSRGARPQAGDRRGRARAHRCSRRSLTEDRRCARGTRVRRRARRRGRASRSGRPLLRRGARDGRRRASTREPAPPPARRARRRRRARRPGTDPAVSEPLEIHVISDSTGETAARFAEAVERQFPDEEFEIVRHPRITSVDDVQLAAARARGRRAVLMYTLVENEFRDAMRTLCRRYRLHYCDLLGHPIDAVARVSGQPATMTPGGQPVLDSSYFKRIEAIEFAVRFDDGVGPGGLKDADIVLVGVSRSSKTPLSIYLGYLGYKTANVPIVPGVEPPRELEEIDPRKIVGLTIDAESLAEIRGERARGLRGAKRRYADLSEIYEELERAEQIHRRLGCPVIEVSNLAIEETARRIIRLVEQRRLEGKAKARA